MALTEQIVGRFKLQSYDVNFFNVSSTCDKRTDRQTEGVIKTLF